MRFWKNFIEKNNKTLQSYLCLLPQQSCPQYLCLMTFIWFNFTVFPLGSYLEFEYQKQIQSMCSHQICHHNHVKIFRLSASDQKHNNNTKHHQEQKLLNLIN